MVCNTPKCLDDKFPLWIILTEESMELCMMWLSLCSSRYFSSLCLYYTVMAIVVNLLIISIFHATNCRLCIQGMWQQSNTTDVRIQYTCSYLSKLMFQPLKNVVYSSQCLTSLDTGAFGRSISSHLHCLFDPAKTLSIFGLQNSRLNYVVAACLMATNLCHDLPASLQTLSTGKNTAAVRLSLPSMPATCFNPASFSQTAPLFNKQPTPT